MRTLLQDASYALRLFSRAPGFTAAAVLSLAIGIGANTAIFSVAHALLFRPLPYADADRLAILWNRSPGLNIAEDWFSTAQYFDIKTGHSGFEDVAIALGANFNLTGHGDPERVGVIRVSSNLLPMLGVRPLHGSLFAASDDQPGQPLSALLSHGTWTRRYAADPGVVGRTILLNGQGARIVGVLPSGFSLPREVLPTLGVVDEGEIYLPLPMGPNAATFRGREDYNIVGRLKACVPLAQAQAEMDALTARLRREHADVYPPNGGLTFSIVPLLDQVVGKVQRPLFILLGAVAFVLLIACANVANLLLSRALSREREVAVRSALGASSGRIVRQLLTESVLLALSGGLLGVVLAAAGLRWIQRLQPTDVPRVGEIGLDLPVLLFTSLISVGAGVLFGLAPSLGIRRLDLQRTLKAEGRGASGAGSLWGRGHRLRRLLVVSELALSLILLIGAGLLLRSVVSLGAVRPGFVADNVLAFELTMTGPRYATGPAVVQAYRDLWTRLAGVGGVTAGGGVSSLPLSGHFAWGPITIEGRTPPAGERFINADQRIVSGRYFEAMQIPLVSGRYFAETDTPDVPRVVIVDAFMAEQFWPGQDAVGKRIRFGDVDSTAPWQTVVGVVGRVKQYGLETDGRIAVYLPQTQSPGRALYVVVRTTGDPASVVPDVRRVVREIDADLPLYRVRPMAGIVAGSLARQRFAATLLSLFAGLALALAAIGVYGVVAYLVSQGTRDIGIRLALGASPRGIFGLVLGQSLRVAGIGITLGLAGALLLARVLGSLVFGVSSRDPLTFATVALLLGVVAVAASAVPALRASRVDPMTALRRE